MSEKRKELQEALCRYTYDTLILIDTVRQFCEGSPEWLLGMETEINTMIDIKDRADRISLKISHVTKSEKKGEALREYMKSKVKQGSADSRREELVKELQEVLKETLLELETLHRFLDAVEKLAVTSLHVFSEAEKVVLNLPKGVCLEDVQVAITAARRVRPLLLQFRRDAGQFFLPKLQNVEVLAYQLDRYIQTVQRICGMMEESAHSNFDLEMKICVDMDADLTEDHVRKMLFYINQLDEIRMNQHFRLVFLFHEKSCSDFVDEFRDRRPRMLEFLDGLEASAAQLDSMNKGAKISSVVGSSVGAVGGVLSIIGLALIPVTAGVSLGLTMAGVGLSVTSGVNSVVTTATEIGVNTTQQKKASEIFQGFMEDVQSLQNHLEEVSSQTVDEIETSRVDVAVGVGRMVSRGSGVVRGIDSLVDAASAVKVLKSEELVVSAGKVVAQEGRGLSNVPKVAADIPDIGKAVLKGPLALSKTARAGFIGLNSLFLGMDVFVIYKDSLSLSKGIETETSQFIRARATLWRSEIDAWEKIHDSLREGLLTSEENKAVLLKPFYSECYFDISGLLEPRGF